MSGLRNRAVAWSLALLLAAAWAAAATVQTAIDRHMAPYRDTPEMLWIPSGRILKTLSLGHDGLLSNIYWTRAVQYYGSRLRDRKTDFSLLDPLLDITVTLDPRLTVAYYFGSIFLSEPSPRGAGRPDLAIKLLERGIQTNPDEWRLWHHLGFIYYWDLQDYAKAAAAYEQGSKHPKAAPFMKVMAAVILEKGGSRDTSLFLWSEIYNSTDDVAIKANALRHLEGLRAQNDVDELERLARLIHDQTGQWPQSLAEMVAQGLLPAVPIDPHGFEYRLQPEGKVALHPDSTVVLDYDRAAAPPQ
jgi:tetratricopeptide (TPR) repeat protein